ncbi:MAG: hypothetical protein WC480_01210 [Patescibacteria group bacterium]
MITLSIFLYIYLFLVVIFILFAMFVIYHVIRFSFWGLPAFLATFLFIAATVIILFVTLDYCARVDWQQPIQILPSGGLFSTQDLIK